MKKVIRIVAALIVLCCAVYLAWYFINSYSNKSSSKNTASQYISAADNSAVSGSESANSNALSQNEVDADSRKVDFEALKKESQNVYAWIYIPSLPDVDYPVVWNGDDSFYLKHSWNGEYNNYGAIFIEAKNSPDFNDLYTIIYGHEMLDNAMFGTLDKYSEKKFFDENDGLIYLYLPERTEKYRIFSVEIVDPTFTGVYTVGFEQGEEYSDFLVDMKNRSIYDTGVSVESGDKVITLSTCTDSGEQRFVVHAKLIDGQ